jgi:hypothetical protein
LTDLEDSLEAVHERGGLKGIGDEYALELVAGHGDCKSECAEAKGGDAD